MRQLNLPLNTIIGNFAASIADITDMITDIRFVAYMDDEYHTIGLACFREGWDFNMGPSRRLPEHIKATARLFAQTNEVEHREQSEIPWIGNPPLSITDTGSRSAPVS